MKLKRKIIFLTCVLGLNACGESSAPAASATPDQAATPPAEIGRDVTGIASCDQYLNDYQACFAAAKVPPEATESAKQGLEATRRTWEMLAKDPSSKASLEYSCKQALETLPKVKNMLGC